MPSYEPGLGDYSGAPDNSSEERAPPSADDEVDKEDEPGALDELFRRASLYRKTGEYKRFLDFVSRFPQYSPYNAALLHVQNPGVSFTATPHQWRERFDRVPEPGARPYVILQPFGPVLFVYDLADTEPRSEEETPLPETVTDPLAVEGNLEADVWSRLVQNCREREKVAVRLTSHFHRRHGGRVETRPFQAGPENPGDCLYRILINSNMELEQQYGALAHELSHLFCGHLGTDDGAWWEPCEGAGSHQKEIEAESVAYLACRRAGLHSVSERYLRWHAAGERRSAGRLLPPVRMRQVLDAVGYIESMGQVGFSSKRVDEK